MKRKYLTEEQYDVCMRALGYVYDEEFDKFFKDEMCFLGNVEDAASEISDLMTYNSIGHVSHRWAALIYYMGKGANFIIGDGAIDKYGIKHKKGLYCSNYRELFSDKSKVKCKKIED